MEACDCRSGGAACRRCRRRRAGRSGSVAAAATGDSPAIVCRADGDRYLLDRIRAERARSEFAARACMRWKSSCERRSLPGILDITPGVRSLQIHYDGRVLSREALAGGARRLRGTASGSRQPGTCRRASCICRLSWDDPATQTGDREVHAVGAAGCAVVPEQHRIHPAHQWAGLRSTMFTASFSTPAIWCWDLGDVYLGAPVATPIDPRHRLVTTKYNPARTWTPENAVGIGGAYLCVYGMEGPGGYQFVGRTLQMWNTYPYDARSFSRARHGCCASSIRSGFSR